MDKDLCYNLALLTVFAIAVLMIIQNNVILREKFIFGKKVKKATKHDLIKKIQEQEAHVIDSAVKNAPTDVILESTPAPVRHIGAVVNKGHLMVNNVQSIPRCPVASNSNVPFSGKRVESFSLDNRDTVFSNIPSSYDLLEGCNDYLYPETRNFMRGEMMGYTVDGKLIPKF